MPLNRDDAIGLLRVFVMEYPGALPLLFNLRANTTELYGPRAGEVPATLKGGYLPRQVQNAGRTHPGRVDFALDNLADAHDMLLTLRHEVLGHYGANTFTSVEKRALLDGLIAAREEPSLKPMWDNINRRYSDRSLDVRAEEVFALHCEGVTPSQHIGADRTRQGQQAFQETCVAPVRQMNTDDLQSIACMVAQGLHDRTRTQQNFPTMNELFRKDTEMEPKKPFHETVAEKLIEQLKQGTAPWQKPWKAGNPGAALPINPTTGKRYKGINAIHLMSQGRIDQRWMTYKQAVAVDAQVRKGEKGTPIQYWKFADEQTKLDANGKPVLDANGEPVKQTVKLERPRVFFATVFNAEQIDGLPPLQVSRQVEWNPLERAEQVLQASGAVIKHGDQERGNSRPRAFYRPATDSIHLPEKSLFPTADNYYATALHELGHWTGHESRLNRDLAHPFGSEGYAKEELRAEIASMILGDELGIGHDPGQHVAYMASWVKALEEDPLEIFRAAADAEKIQDYVLSLEQKLIQEQSAQQSQENQEAQILAELQVLHQAAYEGYSPLESWRNLKASAQVNGLTADIARGGDGKYDPPYVVTYSDQAGHQLPITTQLYNDGKAATSVDGQRVPGTGLTSDHEWQTAALVDAVVIVRRQGIDQGEQMQSSETQIEVGVLTALEDAGWTPGTGAAIATKPFDTVNGKNEAMAFVTRGDGFNRTLQFTYRSEGRNITEGNLALIPVNATTEQARAVAAVAAAKAERTIQESYGVTIARMRQAAQVEQGDTPHQEVQETEHEKAAKLARVNEERVRRDPNSTEEDKVAAKEARKNAEFLATQNDEDLQRRIAEFERQQQAPAPIQASQAPLNAYQAELARLLQLSTVTPGSYTPSDQVKVANHAAVFVDEAPAILCGPSDDPASIAQAEALAASPHVQAAFRAAGMSGAINSGVVAGSRVQWQGTEAAVVAKPSGQVEPGGNDGPLVAIVLNDPKQALATSLCVTTATARIFDANAPELDDGRKLTALSRGNTPTPGVKTFLDVPFKQKDEAKALGAKWDRQEQSWYVPPNVDATPFAQWVKEAATAAVGTTNEAMATLAPTESKQTAQGRQYLAVPYGEHIAAKAAGALWDKAAKSWYAGPKADMTKLDRWAADSVPGQQGPAMKPEDEFSEALQSMGCVVDGKHPIMDGQKHRIAVVGDKKGEQAGFYVGHLDGHPAGYIKNNKTGVEMKWKSKGYALDAEQKARMQAEAAGKLQARDAEQARLQEQAAQRVGRQLVDLVPVVQPTAYMQAKGIEAQPGVFTDKEGQKTYIPATDADGKMWTMQYIQENGTKRFAKDSRKEGCFHVLGGLDALAKAPALVIGEGYATAGSLSEALGFATVAAFDSGNLVHVAKALQAKFPDKPIVIAGDDDKHLEATQGVNPGRSKAEDAAKAIGSKSLLPIFAPGEQSSNPKGFTDFNDLATKSKLGKEGVRRQVQPIVEAVIKKHQQSNVSERQQDRGRVEQVGQQQRKAAKIG